MHPVTTALLQSSKSSPTLSHACRLALRPHTNHFRRPFVSELFNASTSPQRLTASRTLPHPASLIYDVIADVDAYASFLPYCQASTVTKRSAPTATDGKTYPEEAYLSIGFNDSVAERFWSRIYCVPGRVVEAVAGSTETTLTPDEIRHHNPRPQREEDGDQTRNPQILSHLLTRWTLRPELLGQEMTEVNLAIEFQFANPMYAALSSAAAPMVAEKMIGAFERRVKSIVDGSANVQ
ncbi:hypothetical protein M433DRAFT_69315 [Acidomyces richmondensis BFW]|nr:MAG: hypothetical protein FE78DRAFT_151812 [Acidomyces sp. 'richmondensis']KYG44494.1 hypothetical protein M433DRAFT_69315 [Acidomyces richmondensis BFW]